MKPHHKVWFEHHGFLPDWKGKREVIHHKNGDHSDNRIENLELMTQAEHMRLHQKQNPKFGFNSDSANISKSKAMVGNQNAKGVVRSKEYLEKLSRGTKGKNLGNRNASGKRSPEAVANIKAGVARAKERRNQNAS